MTLTEELDKLVETEFEKNPPDEAPYTAGFNIALASYKLGLSRAFASINQGKEKDKEIDYHISPRQLKMF